MTVEEYRGRPISDYWLVCKGCAEEADLYHARGYSWHTLRSWEEVWALGGHQKLIDLAHVHGCIVCGSTDGDRHMVCMCNLEIKDGK